MFGNSIDLLANLPPLCTAERAGQLRSVMTRRPLGKSPEGGSERRGEEREEAKSGGQLGNSDEPLQALLLTNLANIRWLTGFSGSAGLVLLTDDELLLLTDGRYASQAPAELEAAGTEGSVIIRHSGAEQQEAMSAAAAGCKRIGLEADSLTWSRMMAFGKEWLPDADLAPTSGLVESLRRRKTQAEVARITAAATIADEALEDVLPMLSSEPSEQDLACELDYRMRRRGASASAFETIAAGGPNSALPHARPSSKRIRRGELLVLDFGALVDGYRSDMTRTVCSGDLATEDLNMYEVVHAAQSAGLESVAPGVSCAEVDAAARGVIEGAGMGKAFMHSTGHGVGLDIHERPTLSSLSKDVLEEGEVVTVEPGVYFEGRGGVRIEDTVLVTEDGCLPLTRSPKRAEVT